MLEVHGLLQRLARRRQLFHSEADFQHAFAWELHSRCPSAMVRLERPLDSDLGSLHVDVVVELAHRCYAFELKYKTRAIAGSLPDETFNLQNHGAQPIGRYDFMKDLQRLESLCRRLPDVTAWAVLLTNDSAYWAQARGAEDTSAAFSLGNGRRVSGLLRWSARTSPGTKRKRESPIEIVGRYVLDWHDYSTISGHSHGRLRYLAVEVQMIPAVSGRGDS